MKSNSSMLSWQTIADVALSQPAQAAIYLSLCSSIVWTVFFTTYPAAHDKMHALRHHILSVACH